MRLVLKHVGNLTPLDEFGGRPARGPRSGLRSIKDAFLVAEEGRVSRLGPMTAYDPAWEEGADVVSLPGSLVTPGLVDPHTHTVFAGWRADEYVLRLQGTSYQEIMAAGGGIRRTVAATRAAGEDELAALAAGRLDQMLRRGVTTVESKSGYGLDLETELKQLRVNRRLDGEHPVDVVSTYLGAHVVPAGASAGDYVDSVIGEVLPRVAAEGLAAFCDVFCDEGAFNPAQTRRILTRAAELGLGLKLHADELEGSGGAELAVELGATSADHLLKLSDRGLEALASSPTVAVLLPGTAFFLRAGYAPARRLLDRGAAVALATDLNPGSSPLIDLRLVMGLACLQMGLTPAEALAAVTVNAAHAVGLGDRAGSLGPGRTADLVVWRCPDYTHLPYFLGSDLVEAVYKGGRRVSPGPPPGRSP
ncbi:MAG: imidazolonepropionase [bacterium]|nr:imidazolonepropionase [bacterium]